MRVVRDKLAVSAEVAPSTSAAGLYLPGNDNQQILVGTVIAVGPELEAICDVQDDYGQKVVLAPEVVKVGDRVHFPKFNASKVTVDGQEVYVLTVDQILVIE